MSLGTVHAVRTVDRPNGQVEPALPPPPPPPTYPLPSDPPRRIPSPNLPDKESRLPRAVSASFHIHHVEAHPSILGLNSLTPTLLFLSLSLSSWHKGGRQRMHACAERRLGLFPTLGARPAVSYLGHGRRRNRKLTRVVLAEVADCGGP